MHSKEEMGPKISRRSLLKGAGALAFVPLMNVGGSVANTSVSDIKKGLDASKFHTRLVLLGTTGGMTWWPGSNRASASQALMVGDAMYIIDLGFGATHRLAEAFNIHSDDLVRVSAILVDHHQVYPAFAFRFDTNDGSVVISGDTGPDTRGNLQKLAKGADLLVHEVIDNTWVDVCFKGAKKGDPAWPLYHHALTSHTGIDDVGKVAEQCNAKTLVLSHIGPGNTPVARLRQTKNNFSGNLIIGEDRMQVGLGKGGNRISRGEVKLAPQLCGKRNCPWQRFEMSVTCPNGVLDLFPLTGTLQSTKPVALRREDHENDFCMHHRFVAGTGLMQRRQFIPELT